MNRIDDLGTWKIFCEIVKAESLNRACDTLDIEPSSASRFIRDLEQKLGAPLFTRSGRTIQLTDLGRQAYIKIQPILSLHQDMVLELQGDRDKLTGLIRIASHSGIGPAEITPALVDFQKIYPDIQFELHELSAPPPKGFTTHDGTLCDVVIGYGDQTPMPNVIMRYSGEMPFIPCASALYLKKHGYLRHPQDCIKHTGILINTPTRTFTKMLLRGTTSVELQWKNSLIMHNLNSVKSALVLGAGVVPDMPLYHCQNELENKTVIPVLDGWHRQSASCYVFARDEAYNKRRVQVFVDWIAERERQFFESLRQRFPQFFI